MTNKWFSITDMHSGGYRKTPFEQYFVEARCQDEAEAIFERETGEYPHAVACNCCGSNFSVWECEEIETGEKIKIIPLTLETDLL